jgi:alginate O-acetyltransferase complex protein AlgI
VNFTTPIFLFWFLPATAAVYALVPAARLGARNAVLTIASFVFYGFAGPRFLPLLLFSAALDYLLGLALERTERPLRRRLLVGISVAGNLGVLAAFKYGGLLADGWTRATGEAPPDFWARLAATALPVGVSFYTFQTLGYTIDVYRRAVPAARSFPEFLCFVSLFPQLVAGPIVRYAELRDELRARRVDSAARGAAAAFFMAGFAKKILVADVLSGPADALFGGAGLPALSDPSTREAWCGLLCYTFQIYFDFSGYSDMAIGLGLWFGFRFPLNFLAPYRAESITEFWRRWHVTLSQWLRDYLYVPLGGDRRGTARTLLNLLLVMTLGGLWHGASWTFAAWGLWHVMWLAAERARGRRAFYAGAPILVRRILTFLIVAGGWVLFRAETFGDAATVAQALSGGGGVHPGGGVFGRLLPGGGLLVPAALLVACLTISLRRTIAEYVRDGSAALVGLPIVFLLALLHSWWQTDSPFLYYRF